jgi:SulP family sulfate permease
MNRKLFISDLLAGLTVSFAALALGAAFGVMSGRGAFAGMVAAGVIPIITGLFGGTRLSVSGPTGPMTAVSSLVIAFAYDSFNGDKIQAEQFITLVFLLTGLLLIVTSLLRLGKFIHYVPQVVILGFMSGIAMLIWVDQVKVLFGLDGKVSPAGGTLQNGLIALATFLFIVLFPAALKKLRVPRSVTSFVPVTLTVIVVMTVITAALMPGLGRINLGLQLESFGDVVSHLAGYFPSSEIFTAEYLMMALPYSVELVLLGYLDSLLTALIMDHLTKEPSNMNKELFGQGLSNAVSAVFQGIPGAQATIRSVLLFKEGAKTRLGAVSAGVFVLMGFLAFKSYVGLIASAVFIGVLCKAALDVFEKDFVKVYLRRAWFLDRRRNYQMFFVLYTMLVTALVDLNVAVVSGTVLFYLGRRALRFNDLEPNYVDEPVTLPMPAKSVAPVTEKKLKEEEVLV